MVVSRMADHVGRVLSGRYRLIAPIGSGASALVFLADDTRLRRRVAVKVLHQGLADDEAFLRRFRAEAQSAAALNHPNILAVYDWGDDEHEPYLVTEYLAGGSLRALLDTGTRLTQSQVLLVGLEAARALDYAHKRGFVHRDIKPANLLFGDDNRLRIGDFGLARALAEAAWTEPTGAMVGTARYACPEQARGETVDGKGDVYSLGLVLVEAITGRVPFAADTTIATLMARVATPVEVPDSLGPLQKILARAGQPDPADRPTAEGFTVGLLAAAEDLPKPEPLPLAGASMTVGDIVVVDRDPTQLPPPAPEPAPEPEVVAEATSETAPRRKRRWPLVVALVLSLLALAGAAAFAANRLLVPSHTVPGLVGLTEQQAQEQIAASNWNVNRLEGRQDFSKPGNVIAQDPAAGASLEEKKVVTITVSLGNTLTSVPTDLAGKPIEEAAAALEAASLTLGTQTAQHDEDVPAGTVIAVDPATPTQLPKGDPVNVIVSDGPAPRTVPSVPAGSTFEEATAILAEAQLHASRRDDFSDTVPAGTLIGTSPRAGTEVARDSTVQVIFSKGPQPIPIPDVKDKSVTEATSILSGAGFSVTGVQGNPTGKVKSTNPPAGTPRQKGTGVTLIT